jgi:hypothetical protein
VLHRFLMHGEVVDVRPVTVVSDGGDELVLWLADGTPTMTATLPGDIDLRSVSKAEMFGQRWLSRPHRWRNGVLMVLPAGAEYATWLFFSPSGEFLCWYGNLQSRYVRWPGGVDIVDRQLDLVVTPDHAVEWKDEDELAAAVDAGWFTPEESDATYAEAHRLAGLAQAGEPPFDDRWVGFRPDPGWPVPALPDDWAEPATVARTQLARG